MEWDHYPEDWDEDQIDEFASFINYTREIDAGAWELLEEYTSNFIDKLTEALW